MNICTKLYLLKTCKNATVVNSVLIGITFDFLIALSKLLFTISAQNATIFVLNVCMLLGRLRCLQRVQRVSGLLKRPRSTKHNFVCYVIQIINRNLYFWLLPYDPIWHLLGYENKQVLS